MAEPTQKEYFTEWTKPFPRDVTNFGVKSSDLKTITYDKPFFLYGIKLSLVGGCWEYWAGHGNASDMIKDITNVFTITIKMTFENGQFENKQFSLITTIRDDRQKSFVKTGKKIKKIEIIGCFRKEETRQEFGGYNERIEQYWGADGKMHQTTVRVKWYYTVTRYTTINVEDFHLYEHPYTDSGMRIADKNGNVVIPAESVFPSPLRIFHKRIRNIMLVPLGCDFASVFKIKTKDGIRAITTLSKK